VNPQKVFEILGEGGGIRISRLQTGTSEIFLYNHSEFDPIDEGLAVNNKDVFPSFEAAFQLINNKYPWYRLHIETLHDDYRKHVIDILIEKLNDKAISPDDLSYAQNRLEKALHIRLECTNHPESPNWSFTESPV
jgi:hypothetical protein